MTEPYWKLDGSPNYGHKTFALDNPCHRTHMDCEGDCKTCPNKDFFRHLDITPHESACSCLSCEVSGS